MRSNAHQNYLENEVLTAEPMKLVILLYQGAIDAIGVARWQTAPADRTARLKSINKALAIVWELNRSLDMKQGGDVSVQLAKLYGYIRGRLLEGARNLRDEPLAETERLLLTLLEAWRQCENPEGSSPQAQTGVSPYDSVLEDYAHVDFNRYR